MFGNVLLGRSVRDQHALYEHTMTPVDVPAHTSTIRLIAYWENCRVHGGMMMGRDIPARAIAGLLNHITVAEPVGDWTDARMRVVGSGMTTHFGRDASGTLMSSLFETNVTQLQMLLAGTRLSLKVGQPGIVEHSVLLNGLVAMRNELVVLPIRPQQGGAPWALVGVFAF